MTVDGGWNDFDLEVRPDLWTRIEFKTADEEHEGPRRKSHVMARVRLSALTRVALLTGALGALACALGGLETLGLVVTGIFLVAASFALSETVEAGRMAYHAIEECAAELSMLPLGTPTFAARRATRSGTLASTRSGEKSMIQRAKPLVADNPRAD